MNILQPRFLISIFIIMVFLFFSSVAIPAEKKLVTIDFEGLTGPPLENARRAVQLPAGLYENGKLDEALVGSFVREVPQKVREALQPFGYYQPEIKTSWEKEATIAIVY
jgi:translocation and assembly module TamA